MNPRNRSVSAGIHHVTAIASDAVRNLEFYASVLGLRLVKKTVNFDDPGTYHFYFGDRTGRPGTILTFFPWRGARRGSEGPGQATATGFSVPVGSMGFWGERLDRAGVVREAAVERFGLEILPFRDPDGLRLELVEEAPFDGSDPWTGSEVPEDYAIRGFHGVTLTENALEPSARLLVERLGFEPAGEVGDRYRFEARGSGSGRVVELLHRPNLAPGGMGAGTVHHVAYRAADDEQQGAFAGELAAAGVPVTPVQDRRYFRSIYFREPGGVLFEIATDSPGFATDESIEDLGTALMLPPWLESSRDRIESVLQPLESRSSVGG